MKILTSRISWGLLLIAGGVLFLLQNLSILPESAPFWAVIFGALGLYFLAIFFSAGSYWWAAFPAFSLLGLSATLYVVEMSRLADEWAGAIFLGMTGLSFFAIYLRSRTHWWPLIPGGSLLSLTGVVIVTAVDTGLNDAIVPAVLFGGLALTFLLLYVAPSEASRARWAIWPGGALLVLALITGAGAIEAVNLVFPIMLIVLGAFILLRSFQKR